MATPIKLNKTAVDPHQVDEDQGVPDLRHRPPTPATTSEQDDILVQSETSTLAPPFPQPLMMQREAALMEELRLKLNSVSRPPEEILYTRRLDQSDKLESDRARSAPGATPFRHNESPPVVPLRRSRTADSSNSPSSSTAPPAYPGPLCTDRQVPVGSSSLFSPRPSHRDDRAHEDRHIPSASTPSSTFSSSSSSTVSPFPSLSMVYGNYSTLNPLLIKNVVFDSGELGKRCPTLLKITEKKKFDAQEAAKEVTQCLALPQGPELLSETLLKLKRELEGTKREPRFHELMACLLLFPQAVRFTSAFVALHEDCDEFSLRMITLLNLRESAPLSVIYSLSLFTKNELPGQTLDTLFRGTNLSTSLCKEYGLQLLDPELRLLGRSVKRSLEKSDLLSLCLNEKLLQKHLSVADAVPPSEVVAARLQENIISCKSYFREMLTWIYQMRISPECQSLLAMRRAQIGKHFDLSHSDERLIAFTGQLLFLRILNPFLIEQGTTELERSALVSLTKITQALTNQIPFGTEKQDPIFKSFNDIYEDFRGLHQQFINANSA
ncbi:MAG: hypothetical protein JSR39_04125 [Verrucomicrobia bacterium]|nr:hypothetical protein [Verrucomicrobiota bacterium]